MLHKNIPYRRWQRKKHIEKRKRICHQQDTFPVIDETAPIKRLDFSRTIPMEWYDVDGKYDKGKIHKILSAGNPYASA